MLLLHAFCECCCFNLLLLLLFLLLLFLFFVVFLCSVVFLFLSLLPCVNSEPGEPSESDDLKGSFNANIFETKRD